MLLNLRRSLLHRVRMLSSWHCRAIHICPPHRMCTMKRQQFAHTCPRDSPGSHDWSLQPSTFLKDMGYILSTQCQIAAFLTVSSRPPVK